MWCEGSIPFEAVEELFAQVVILFDDFFVVLCLFLGIDRSFVGEVEFF